MTRAPRSRIRKTLSAWRSTSSAPRSEEHTSELQSQSNLVCRLLLEKKKNTQPITREQPQSTNPPAAITHDATSPSRLLRSSYRPYSKHDTNNMSHMHASYFLHIYRP